MTSDGTNLNWSTAPCNDYTPGDETDQGTQSAAADNRNNQTAQSQSSSGGQIQQQTQNQAVQSNEEMVWVSATGTKYHKTNHCGTMNPDTATQETKAEAEAQGLEPCKKCY